ncbi:MAG: hypothetical protein ACAI35_08135 [Candidatus Methylacidiphilales bacterium]|nr:hypothetical protein [Candidatus Methylacidiphilales bacterium]
MRKILLPSLHSIAAILAAFFLALNLTGCASTPSKAELAQKEAYVTKRTKYYLGEGGLSDESMALTAATADWESGKLMEDSDKRLGMGAYKVPGKDE